MSSQQELNREAHRKVIERLRSLSPEESREALIASGILTQDGELAPQYRPLDLKKEQMTHEEMLQLATDAEQWRDPADWKDNCGRLGALLAEIPGMIAELKLARILRDN